MTDPQVIVNLGTGGADLNGQNGSTSSADSNDARFLDWPGDNAGNYVYLPGASGNYLSVPDEAALDITGDIDIRVYLAADDWTPSANATLLAKYDASPQRSYEFRIGSGNQLILTWSPDGSSEITKVSTANPSFSDGEAGWVRATLDVDNGSSGNDVKFYTSTDGVTWVQLGSTLTTAGTTSIYSGTSNLSIGMRGSTGFPDPAGKFYRAQILDGIDGTTVLDVDTSVITSGSATSFTALTGQTVTINRSTSGRKSVAVVSPVWLFGTDDYWEIADNALLDFGASDSFTTLVVVRQWATPVGFQRYLAKQDATTAGYLLLNNSTNLYHYFVLDDGPTAVGTSPSVNTYSLGQVTVLGGIRDTSSDTIRHFVNSTLGTAFTDTTTLSLSNTGALRIGANSPSAADYVSLELLGVAVFRRALTQAEIISLTTYYQNRLS